MKNVKKGQVSIEVLMMVGLILLITLPFIAGALGNLSARTNLESKVDKAVNIAQHFETISNLGPGNGVIINLPDKAVIIENNTLKIDEVSILLVPTVEDIVLVDSSTFAIVNTGSVKLAPPPSIVYETVEPVDAGEFVELRVEYFDLEYGNVFFDGNAAEVVNEVEGNIQFQVPAEINTGNYEVYLKMNYGNVELVSELIYLDVIDVIG
jgi:hypothetical protein